MSSAPKRETAIEIAKRYGLADLVRTRMLARRLYLNSLTRKASIAFQDSLDILDLDLTPLEVSLLQSRRFLFLNDPVTSRRSLLAFDTRCAYNRRLTEIEAEKLDADERVERLLSRYLIRSKVKKMSGKHNDKDMNETGLNEDESNEENIEQNDKEDDDDEILEDNLYPDGLDANYLGYLASPYDLTTWRQAKRLFLRRLYPYRLRPLDVATRLLERRLRDL